MCKFDSELTKADSNEKKLAILFKRSEEGMLIFCEKKFTDAVQFKDGVQVQYKIKVVIHSPNDGLTVENATYEYAFKCIKSGTGENDPAEFEYIGKEQISAL